MTPGTDLPTGRQRGQSHSFLPTVSPQHPSPDLPSAPLATGPCSAGLLAQLLGTWLKSTAKPQSKPPPSWVLFAFCLICPFFSRKYLMPLKFETQTQSLQDPAQSGASASPGGTNHEAVAQWGRWWQSPPGVGGSGRGCSFPPLYPCGETHRKSWVGLAPVGTTVPKFRHLQALLPRHGKAGPGGTGAAPAGETLTDRRHSQTPLLPPLQPPPEHQISQLK